MTTLIVGASGATGKQLVDQLLKKEHKLKIIVRSINSLPESWKSNNRLTIIQASVLDIKEDDMAKHLMDCESVALCLGHNISFKGIYGQPRKLVTEAVSNLCNAIKKNLPNKAVKLVLMNTTGNQNRDLNEPISRLEKIVMGLIRLLLPPQLDNEEAADYLRTKVGQKDNHIEWVAVRPDNLINEDIVTKYEEHPSPIRSAIFDPGKTSRINVANFMSELIADNALWNKWKGQMPVIYNITEK